MGFFSIKRRVFLAMAAASLIPLLLFTVFALRTIYRRMYGQLVSGHAVSMEWLAIRLGLSVRAYAGLFYEYEVDKDFRSAAARWAFQGGLDNEGHSRIRAAFERTLSVDPNINAVELYNPGSGGIYVSTRASSRLLKQEPGQEYPWKERDPSLQTNLVFINSGNEICITHTMYQFETGLPIAVILMRMRPAVFAEYLAKVKINGGESVILFNDQDQKLFEEPAPAGISGAPAEKLLASLRETPEGIYIEENRLYFYAAPGGGKIQAVYIVPSDALTEALRRTSLGSIVIAVAALIAALLFSVMFLDRMLRRNQELLMEEYQIRIEKRDAQFRALRAQINPHFLSNTLQVIGGMALRKDAPEIYAVAAALSGMFRYALGFSPEMVALEQETAYLDSYCAIQNHRFGGRIRLEKDIAPETEGALVPRLILQPLLENSFEHGLKNKAGDWVVGIIVREIGGAVSNGAVSNGDMEILVYDNGLGIKEERLAEIRRSIESGGMPEGTAHIGLTNVHARLRLKYGAPYGLTLDSEYGKGTLVKLLLRMSRGV